MKNTIFTGAGIAIITPMNADGSINYQGLGDLIENQIANGTDAIISCGTTGEASTMTDEEHLECIRFAVVGSWLPPSLTAQISWRRKSAG